MTDFKTLPHGVGFRTRVTMCAAIAALALVSVAARRVGPPAVAPTASVRAAADTVPILTTLPEGYRDWTLISVAALGGPFMDLRAKLGNPDAIRTYRAGTLPFPDGAILARLAWKQVTSEENNAALRTGVEGKLSPDAIQKFLAANVAAGPATNVQFMVKDSKKYAATGGWGFAQFTNGKPDGGAVLTTCFACHTLARNSDFVFTHYSR